MTKKISIVCDECKKEMKDEETYWSNEHELYNAPTDMAKSWELDVVRHLCTTCKPLGEYEKTEVDKE